MTTKTSPKLAMGAYETRRRVLEVVLDESFREHERANAAADLAGRAIGRGNARNWGHWLLWILQMLDDRFPDAAEGAMREVREAIERRLETGEW